MQSLKKMQVCSVLLHKTRHVLGNARGNELHFIEIIFLTFILIAHKRINARLCGERATD